MIELGTTHLLLPWRAQDCEALVVELKSGEVWCAFQIWSSELHNMEQELLSIIQVQKIQTTHKYAQSLPASILKHYNLLKHAQTIKILKHTQRIKLLTSTLTP